jgi:hypothetical protein
LGRQRTAAALINGGGQPRSSAMQAQGTTPDVKPRSVPDPARQEFMVVSRTAEIVTFVRLADGGLSARVLAAAIRRRWPETTPEEVRQAKAEAAKGLPEGVDERAVMDIGFAAMLGRRS